MGLSGLGIGALELPNVSRLEFFLSVYVGAIVLVLSGFKVPVTQRSPLQLLPWLVTAAILQALAVTTDYPWGLSRLLSGAGAFLVILSVVGSIGICLLLVSSYGTAYELLEPHIGIMGAGTVSILFSIFVLQGVSLPELLLVVGVPAIAVLATVVVTLSTWLWSPDAMEYADLIGAYVIFGVLLYGLTTVTSIEVRGATAHTTVTAGIRDLVLQYWVQVPWFDWSHVWVWGYLFSGMMFAVVIVASVAPLAKLHSRGAYAFLGTIGSAFVALGFADVFLLVVR